MKRAAKYFSKHDRTRIEQAVTDAEQKTSAEIVPALATESGRYDRAEDVAGLWLGLIAMAIVWAFLQTQNAEAAQWGSNWSRFELPLLIATVVIGFVVGNFVATWSTTVRRLFTPRKHMVAEVERAANHFFFDRRIHHTEGATGLLIYISLFEHTARITADEAVVNALGQPALDELCAELIQGIQAGDLATSLCGVIADAGERLAKVLPHDGSPTNEIENALIIAD